MVTLILIVVAVVIVVLNARTSSLAGSMVFAVLVPFVFNVFRWILSMFLAYDIPHRSFVGAAAMDFILMTVICVLAAFFWHAIRRPETTKNRPRQ